MTILLWNMIPTVLIPVIVAIYILKDREKPYDDHFNTLNHTNWVLQRMVVEMCGVSEKDLKDANRVRYKASLLPSWQKITSKKGFLGRKDGRSWRWGKKNGQYYYDIDTSPNRKPAGYHDKLPPKDELIRLV